ncbi:hypothetical protein TNCV_4081001, partial [Trichonephila clavipes]
KKSALSPSHDKNESSFSVDQQRESQVEVKAPMREVG